jgi:putative acetyltransferase
MNIRVLPADPRDPRAVALLQASHALMQELFPAEANHYLSIDALCAPDIHFLVAREGDIYHGCGALALKSGYGEVKSMFVGPGARGRGVADLLLHALVKIARADGVPILRLETGNSLTAAHKLYEKHGFSYCGPFGDYGEEPLSLFMERIL